MSNTKLIKYGCYSANISMAAVCNVPPVLFLTFREMYGISYSLLGLLVLINFLTQLTIDLIFSFFSHKFNIEKTVRYTPLITFAGLLIFAVCPYFAGKFVYMTLVIGTILYSVSAGLSEVLISPVIAALPAKDPEREMSKLHSIYAWGVVGVIPVATLFLYLFGNHNWQLLIFVIMAIPLASFIFFSLAKIPEIETPEKTEGAIRFLKQRGVWLCVFAIFLGGAAECTMAQWSSGYLERALGIPKIWGDCLGVALFALMLGTGRTFFAQKGKNVGKFIFIGAIGSTVCYLLAALSPFPVVGLFACAFTGLCVSMFWPGSLIAASERYPESGVLIYALMAAGGDFGASVGPQLIGVITDAISRNPGAVTLAQNMGMAGDQFGMKMGMLIGVVVSVVAIPVYYHIHKTRKAAGQES